MGIPGKSVLERIFQSTILARFLAQNGSSANANVTVPCHGDDSDISSFHCGKKEKKIDFNFLNKSIRKKRFKKSTWLVKKGFNLGVLIRVSIEDPPTLNILPRVLVVRNFDAE